MPPHDNQQMGFQQPMQPMQNGFQPQPQQNVSLPQDVAQFADEGLNSLSQPGGYQVGMVIRGIGVTSMQTYQENRYITFSCQNRRRGVSVGTLASLTRNRNRVNPTQPNALIIPDNDENNQPMTPRQQLQWLANRITGRNLQVTNVTEIEDRRVVEFVVL